MPSTQLLLAASFLSASALAQTAASVDPDLVGTWTTKSRKVFTGPGFYDPVNENIFEPELTGISYSFTADGYYEEAYYRAIPNPIDPACPKGIIQWQHGSFTQKPNGSLSLTPFAVDGRQLLSDPCKFDNSIFTRYNQSETFVKYEQLRDPYNSQERLNLYEWDGTPMNPMWLAYRPPEMLPTSTLNPTATPTATSAANTGSTKLVRRNLGLDGEVAEEILHPVRHHFEKRQTHQKETSNFLIWAGLAMTGVGGVLYVFSS